MTRSLSSKLTAAATAILTAGCATPPATPPPAAAKTRPTVDAPASPPAKAQAQAQKTRPAPSAAATRNAPVTAIGLDGFFPLHQSGKALVFDARPLFVYNFGRIPGAIHMPPGRCDADIASRSAEIRATLASGGTIVVYCTGPECPDAHTVAARIAAAGHPASVFTGGWDAWKNAGMPVE